MKDKNFFEIIQYGIAVFLSYFVADAIPKWLLVFTVVFLCNICILLDDSDTYIGTEVILVAYQSLKTKFLNLQVSNKI